MTAYQLPLLQGYLRQKKANTKILKTLELNIKNKLETLNHSGQLTKQINTILNHINNGPKTHLFSNASCFIAHSALLMKAFIDDKMRERVGRCPICNNVAYSAIFHGAPILEQFIQSYFHKQQQRLFITQIRKECKELLELDAALSE